MSFSSSSSPRGSEHAVRRKGDKKAAEEEPAALYLLDDYWFFSNPLGGRADTNSKERTTTTRPPLLPKSPSTSSAGAGSPGGRKAKADACRRLLRTPSLPSPRIGLEPSPSSLPKDEELAEDDAGDRREAEVEEDDDMNWSKIYEGVLRTRIAEEGRRSSSELNRAPSMPLTSSATMGRRRPAGFAESTPTMPRLRHSHSTLDRHYSPRTPSKSDRTPRMTGGGGRAERGPRGRDLRSFSVNQQPALVRDKSGLQDKMWKSSSALESIEVQGFKDLGFVFDQEELRESLADVLPGLRDDKTTTKPPHKSSASVSGSISGSASDNDDPNAADGSNGTGIGIGASNAVGNDGVVQRPYLSEAWQHGARSAPPTTGAAAIRLQQADARSAAEMKDQIRMWAQAVACNVRQEC